MVSSSSLPFTSLPLSIPAPLQAAVRTPAALALPPLSLAPQQTPTSLQATTPAATPSAIFSPLVRFRAPVPSSAGPLCCQRPQHSQTPLSISVSPDRASTRRRGRAPFTPHRKNGGLALRILSLVCTMQTPTIPHGLSFWKLGLQSARDRQQEEESWFYAP